MVNERLTKEVLCIAFRAVRFGEQEMEKAIKRYLASRGDAPEVHGRMKLKELMQRDQGAKMMEIAPDAVRGFQRVAKKFNVDFAITKDKSKEPPLFQVFFKARDEDVILKAFNEYVRSRERKAKREPFAKKLEAAEEKTREINAAREVKEKTKVIERTQ